MLCKCSVQIALPARANWSVQVGLRKLLCATGSAQVARAPCPRRNPCGACRLGGLHYLGARSRKQRCSQPASGGLSLAALANGDDTLSITADCYSIAAADVALAAALLAYVGGRLPNGRRPAHGRAAGPLHHKWTRVGRHRTAAIAGAAPSTLRGREGAAQALGPAEAAPVMAKLRQSRQRSRGHVASLEQARSACCTTAISPDRASESSKCSFAIPPAALRSPGAPYSRHPASVPGKVLVTPT